MKPGTYQAKAGHTLMVVQVIGLAGGFTKDADKKKVSITRNGAPENITVDLQKVLSGSAPDVLLQDGDVIRVPEVRSQR